MSIWDSFDSDSLDFLATALEVAGGERLADLYPGRFIKMDDGLEFLDRCDDLARTLRQILRDTAVTP